MAEEEVTVAIEVIEVQEGEVSGEFCFVFELAIKIVI